MKNKIIKFLLLFTLPILSSCAHYGGGTVGTGLPLAGNTTSGFESGVVYFSFYGTILSKNNKPVSFATLIITTSKIEESIMTDGSGDFNVEIIADSKELALISVRLNNELYRGTFSIPDGVSENMTATIILDTENKSITVSDLE